MGNSTDLAYSDLLFRASNDGGTTFGKTISLSQNHKLIIGDAQMTSSGSSVYIVDYGSYWGSTNGAVLFMASHDNGSTFDHVIITNDTMVFTPQLAVSGNNVYIVWMEMKGQVTSCS